MAHFVFRRVGASVATPSDVERDGPTGGFPAPWQRNFLTAAGVLALGGLLFAWPESSHTGSPRAVLALGVSVPLPEPIEPVEVRPLAPPKARVAATETSARVAAAFAQLGYDISLISSGFSDVPPVFLASMPADLGDLPEPAARKRIFFKAVLPLVLRVNDDIRTERRRVLHVVQAMEAGHGVAAAERAWLKRTMERYEVQDDDVHELLRRVDVIPPSLALAQAAEESGWGTSRFVREGNALFGQYTTAVNGHLLPDGLDHGHGVRIQAFPSLLQSVDAYALNLNTHNAYRSFRQTRAEMRADGGTLDGAALAKTLDRYSARGKAYVRTILSLIRGNNLAPLDGARLAVGTEAGSDA